ncbi:ABC transporter ATP-binding protein [Pararobbsia silviterrae]|uniref:ATP-binding cassette domain-containing protein n=1 Tax=Pararobbsia silviterrae TaxID=1792498 RepID=A0A494Y815_9BURK|nr:ATP-binding cassette domain-containing protein [Pararobbsia silviterrae]RKP56060.1 ATP-binding cassette domain-containing protein [Pararobbsia silviterrae]
MSASASSAFDTTGARTAPVLIEVRDLVNRFGTRTVHDHLNLDVMRGEILGVVGGSGSGKSVLLRSIVGLLRPTSGTVRIASGEIFADAAARHDETASRNDGDGRPARTHRMGVLFQRGALFSSLSLLENIALPLIEHAGLTRVEAERIARMKLALVGLEQDTANVAPAALSGGMTKRAALARALALDPDVLFLDEPTAGLDPVSAGAFDALTSTLRDALGLTVFLVTHDLDTLYTICDRVAVIANGRVRVAGTLDVVAQTDDAWIKAYFHGPRGRAAYASHAADGGQ